MTFKVFTQEEVNAILPDENGNRWFPTGDYSAIKKFGAECRFDKLCVFGPDTCFDKECGFAIGCVFSNHCNFVKRCIFGPECSFGSHCTFSKCCKFGIACNFDVLCSFGDYCYFGGACTFEKVFKTKTKLPFITLSGVGWEARTCYFYDFEEGIHVRAGCFFGTLEEFKDKVLKDEKTPDSPSKKTRVYLAFCGVAEIRFL